MTERRMSAALTEPQRVAYTLGSLFTGIGGIDLAFVRAGFSVAFQVEIDDYCRKVLAKHAPEFWPTAQVFEDVKHVGAANLPNVDVLAGGFPCQDISSAGKRAGIKEGTRSGLWLEFARVIGEIRPRIVMLENVAAITTRDGIKVISDLTKMGYDAEWGIIPASAVGAPHERKRWWCVAYRNNSFAARTNDSLSAGRNTIDACRTASVTELAHCNEIGRRAFGPERTVWEGATSVIRGSGELAYSAIDNPQLRFRLGASSTANEDDGSGAANSGCALGFAQSTGLQSIIDGETFSRSASAGNGPTQSILGRAVDGVSRQLDGARWPGRPGSPQSFWEAPRTIRQGRNRPARLRALGNAVVPQVVQPIAEAIRTYLEEVDQAAGSHDNR